MKIGSHLLKNNLMLAPMAGVTDRPFRQLCRKLGAGMVVSEMITSDPKLQNRRKTKLRMDHNGEPSPRVIQIAGADPKQLAVAAAYNADHGADIIDINMGCPAKKVCNRMAGSALLRDEVLVGRILESVVKAVSVPVSLKMRTGWNPDHRNATTIANIAENAGIQALTVHGRTRACGFKGEVEHETAREIKALVSIPLIVNGDICTPQQAAKVLEDTAADGVMIGRAAQGNPWIFREILYFLKTGKVLPAPGHEEVGRILLSHLENLYDFYGEYMGVRIARKHLGWYCRYMQQDTTSFREAVNKVRCCNEQLQMVSNYFELNKGMELAA